MLTGEFARQFEILSATGHAAKDEGQHNVALDAFRAADQLATTQGDDKKRLDALNPAARALWTLGRYDEALATLHTASAIAHELNLPDERGIAISNMGRLAAVQTVHTVPVGGQREALRRKAVPKFSDAYDTLRGHSHLYFRYANAHHGSTVAALAGRRLLATKLLVEGFWTAFRKSGESYDKKPPYQINKLGLVQLAGAAALIPFGDKTPFLAGFARRKLIR